MAVRIVTDSAADLPDEVASRHRIAVVPLTVRFGQTTYTSGVDLDTNKFWDLLRASDEAPATAAPSAGTFEQTFRQLAEEGADEIVAVHLSSKLSATAQSATIAAQAVDTNVKVFDSLSASAATGLMALRAAELASEGQDAASIFSELEAMRDSTVLYGVIDTLDYLRRGGRIGGAQALLGTMLQVKPVISVVDGVVEPVGKVRTRAKAMQHLVGLVKARPSIKRLVLVDGQTPDVDQLREMLQGVVEIFDTWTLGPVVGAHAGPGVIGVAFTT